MPAFDISGYQLAHLLI